MRTTPAHGVRSEASAGPDLVDDLLGAVRSGAAWPAQARGVRLTTWSTTALPGPRAARWHGVIERHVAATVVTLAVTAVLVRLPFVISPLTSDEAGFLMVGSQWSPGTSLYGAYWVDRPPGLVAIFAVVSALGGQVALRLVGAWAAALAVVAASAIGGRLAPGRRTAPVLCGLLVLALVSSPLVDMTEVDGEILALPLVLAGLAMLVRAVRPSGGVAVGWSFGAGAAAGAAASVKQDLVDVGVAAVVLAVALLARRRGCDAVVLLGSFTVGCCMTGVALLLLAVSRGTGLAGLWQAIVVFRVEAAAAIAQYAPTTVGTRGTLLLGAFVATGAPVLLAALLGLRWRASPWPWVVGALLAWESVCVVAGGSYWLHYLVGVVPGLALLLAVGLSATTTHDRGVRRLAVRAGTGMGLRLVVVSSVGGLCFLAARPPARSADEQAVIDYLSAHRDAGTSGVTAFGDPALLQQSGLHSPYPDLWSLPVRVHDPSLSAFSTLLRGDARPEWVVVNGSGLGSWGLDASAADRVLARHYRDVFTAGTLHVMAQRT